MGKTAIRDTPLPWPDEWATPQPKALAAGSLGVVALALLWLGTAASSSGHLITAVLFIASGVYIGSIAALGTRRSRPPREAALTTIRLRIAGSDDDGVAMSYSGWERYWLTTNLLMVSAGLAALATHLLLHWPLPSFVPASGGIDVPVLVVSAAGVVLIVVSGAVALYCLWFVVEIARGRAARAYLVLSPSGIHHRRIAFEHFTPWHAVHAVRAQQAVWYRPSAFRGKLVEEPDTPLVVVGAYRSTEMRTRRVAWVIVPEHLQRWPDLEVRGRWLAVDPAVVYHALRYYHSHPDARAELLTPAGVQRIRSGDLLH